MFFIGDPSEWIGSSLLQLSLILTNLNDTQGIVKIITITFHNIP
jgi:hypothetical protein